MEKRTCIVCQVAFAQKAWNQKTCCKECSEIARKRYIQAYWKVYQRPLRNDVAKHKTPQEGMALLSKHAREAQKMRLSYGKYMAKRRIEAK